MRKLLGLIFLPLVASVGAPAQQLDFKQPATADPAELAGTPNPWLQRSLRHPSYDKFWQEMVPYKEDFAKKHVFASSSALLHNELYQTL